VTFSTDPGRVAAVVSLAIVQIVVWVMPNSDPKWQRLGIALGGIAVSFALVYLPVFLWNLGVMPRHSWEASFYDRGEYPTEAVLRCKKRRWLVGPPWVEITGPNNFVACTRAVQHRKGHPRPSPYVPGVAASFELTDEYIPEAGTYRFVWKVLPSTGLRPVVLARATHIAAQAGSRGPDSTSPS
jgi:hypothetical protein